MQVINREREMSATPMQVHCANLLQWCEDPKRGQEARGALLLTFRVHGWPKCRTQIEMIISAFPVATPSIVLRGDDEIEADKLRKQSCQE